LANVATHYSKRVNAVFAYDYDYEAYSLQVYLAVNQSVSNTNNLPHQPPPADCLTHDDNRQ